jgi:hypothetical protein
MHALSRRGVAATALFGLTAAAAGLAVSATASAGLSVTPITWNVVGLDSNKPATSGPDTFPVGTRVCNDSADVMPGVVATLAWDSVNDYLSVLGPSTHSLGDLAAGACDDAYFNVQVSRTSDAFDTTRAFHVTATSGVTSVSTPADRELYVEKLVSQNRNGVDAITSTAIDAAPSSAADGHATVNVGETYVFHVTSHTATGGYEQLESAVDFPSSIFRVLDVSASYTVPSAAINDGMYADACGWDPSTTSASYRSCVGPEAYAGGKAGGQTIETDYTVEVVAAGVATVTPIIYDFSGSSFHYNSDLGLATASVAVDAVDPTEEPPGDDDTDTDTEPPAGDDDTEVDEGDGGEDVSEEPPTEDPDSDPETEDADEDGTDTGGSDEDGTVDEPATDSTDDDGETAVLPREVHVPHARPDSSGGVLDLHGSRPPLASPLPYTGAPVGLLLATGLLLALAGAWLCALQPRVRREHGA